MKSKEWAIKTTGMILLGILIALSIFVLIKGWLGGYFQSIDALQGYIDSYGIWGPLVLLLIQALITVIPVLPSFLGCIAGAMLFGPVVGFLVNYIGISVGSIADYFLARKFGESLVDKMVKLSKFEDYREKIRKSKSYTTLLFVAILLPLAPDNFLCYFSGLIKMRAKKFISIIIVAKPWCILFYSIFFAYFI